MGNILDSTQMTINGKSVRALSINNKVAWESSEEFSGYPCIAEALRNKPLRNYTVKGRTLVVNQQTNTEEFLPCNGTKSTSDNKVYTLTRNVETGNLIFYHYYYIGTEFGYIRNHYYLLIAKAYTEYAGTLYMGVNSAPTLYDYRKSTETNKWVTLYYLMKYADGQGNGYEQMQVGHDSTAKAIGETLHIKEAMRVDLTLMFGAGNEPTTALAYAQARGYSSIEEVPYEEYNAGEVQGVGVPVKWNQILPYSQLYPAGLTITKGYGYAIASGTPSPSNHIFHNSIQAKEGNKYLAVFKNENMPENTSPNSGFQIYDPGNKIAYWGCSDKDIINGKQYGAIFEAQYTYSGVLVRVRVDSSITYSDTKFFIPMVFDLTEMGIADKVTSVDDFKSYLVSIGAMSSVDGDIPYFEYSSESIKYKVPIISKCKNLFNLNTAVKKYLTVNGSLADPDYSNMTSDYIEVTPGVTYTYSLTKIGNPSASLWTGWWFYDKDKNKILSRYTVFVDSYSFTVPSEASYIRIGSRDILNNAYLPQLEIGKSATFYSPYHAPEEIAVLMDTPLHGIGTALDRLDYKSSLKENKYRTVDLGDFTYRPYGTEYEGVFYIIVEDYKKWNGILCSKYSLSNQAISSMPDKSMAVGSGGTTTVWFKDTSLEQTAEALKAAMTGSTLVYCPDSDPTLSEVLAPALGCFKGGARYEVEGTVKPSEIIVTR